MVVKYGTENEQPVLPTIFMLVYLSQWRWRNKGISIRFRLLDIDCAPRPTHKLSLGGRFTYNLPGSVAVLACAHESLVGSLTKNEPTL